MPYRSLRRRTSRLAAVAATSVLAALGVASTASAATTVTVTGDDGVTAVPLGNPGPTIRNMQPTVAFGFPADASLNYSATFAGPNGTGAGTAINCYIATTGDHRSLDYLGNGTYTVTVTSFAKADYSCSRGATSTETFTFTINAFVGIAPPPATFMIRNPDSYARNTLSLDPQLNTGAGGYDIQYASGAVLNPDGSISGAPQTAFINSATGKIETTLPAAGVYTFVMRAHALGNPTAGTAWSAPVKVLAQVPFDLSTISYPDSIGPSFLIRGTLNDNTIRGKVSIAVARRGKHNRYGSYKRLGSVKISSRGTFSKRFTQHRSGIYRFRMHYAGSSTTPARSVYKSVRISRRLL